MRIPSGFVFAPTKVELLYHYLYPKIMNPGFIFGVPSIREANIYQCHPQQLLEGTEEDSAYFFTRITRKGGKASRTVGGYGYWRISTTDSIEEGGAKVGEKNTLAFYTGFQSDKKKNKTNWLMQEYSFCKERNGEEWVVCRIYLKKGKK
ncbi:hypothetical protein MKW94_011048 [Papaver nudicaule]|uniref:NAC domain-containing protein n=1 Tax=Papaver nudicaule TaxID=74823 RepID=A0AA41VL97_PAPNU|nr:hypothetical protein [Papaver nudicaule]